MANRSKVRVQLLDPVTGAVLEEVDVLTSADAVTFADGQTFQQKLDAGLLKGAQGGTGATGSQGPKGDKGDTGAIGPQGPKGDTGATGPQGVKGADGKTWHITAAVPANTLGAIGDMHLNTATFDIREKTAAAVWTVRGNIKGATGVQGVKGDKGDKGDTGSTGAKGDKGDPGDNVKFGTTLATASEVKLFLKKV